MLLVQDQSDQSHSLANGILDNKTQTVLTSASNKTSTFLSPIGTLQLTPEECNEILMKRAAAAQQHNHTTITTTDGQHTGTIGYIGHIDVLICFRSTGFFLLQIF